MTQQALLSPEQIRAFYHDHFVADQVHDFVALAGRDTIAGVVVDVGGGCGYFAHHLQNVAGAATRVLDTDPGSVRQCAERNVEAVLADALQPDIRGDESVVTFNLILHHLVGGRESETRAMQKGALQAWSASPVRLFVNEYIYQSFLGNLSGRLIFAITSSRILSRVGRAVARFVPALRANTFGVGVRFRSHDEWIALFRECGYKVIDRRLGTPEPIPLPLRALLIAQIRRDSFLLERC
jgi:hypothetical protein